MQRALLFVIWLAVLAIEVIALRASLGIPFSDDLESRFRGGSPAYARYEALLADYGRLDTDIVVLFEAEDFADPESRQAVSDFLIEVQFLPRVAAVLSPFSFELRTDDGTRQPLFSPGLEAETQRARLRQGLEELTGLDRVLAHDLTAMQALVLTEDLPSDTKARSAILAEFRALADSMSRDGPVTITLTGYPVIRAAVTDRLDADTALLNGLGVVAGLAVAWIALRSFVLSLAIALTAHTARLWSVTALLPFGYEINAVTITLPTLIVVLAFSEAIHIAQAARRTWHDGRPAPLRRAMLSVWPAALLAALTTGGAFAALMLSRSELVTGLAFYGMAAIAISTPLVFVLFGLFAATLDRTVGLRRFLRPPPSGAVAGFGALIPFVRRNARHVSLAGMVLVAVSTLGYSALEPNYSLYEGLRERDPELRALRRIEAEFGPVTGLQFEHPVDPPQALDRAVAALSELSPWGPAFAIDIAARDDLPEALRARLLSRDGARTLVTLPYPYVDSRSARADIEALQERISGHPDLSELGPVTGVVHVSSLVSAEILRAFSLCFALAAAAAGVLVAIWLRSLSLGLLSVVPNVLPITVVGSLIWLTGQPFSFTSGIALTIAFGIAVDDTVHVINRMRALTRGGRRLTEDVVLGALQGIGPTLVLTSAILIGGLSGTLFSSLPTLVSFGLLSIAVFVLALLADLVLLPALFIERLKWGHAISINDTDH